ncbi:MAG: Ferredoxin [Chlorobi bacterium OLB7]|nr:MAG: Ferredoxin [Chlorobi bacterium OLB7]
MRYAKHLFICTNEREPGHPRGSCKNCGSEELRSQFKQALKERRLHGTMRANSAGCLDACEYGAAMVVYPDNVWYGGVTTADIDEIIESHLIGGQPVQRLRIPHKRYTPEDQLPFEIEEAPNNNDQP